MSGAICVFISSTLEDLRRERDAVERALSRLQSTSFAGMEYFGSRPETPREASLAELDRSDVYIGIFAGRYGSGITEDEYRYARQKNIPVLIYFRDDSAPIDPAHIEVDPEKSVRLQTLKKELRLRHTVSFFTTPDDLATKVVTDLYNFQHRKRPEDSLTTSLVLFLGLSIAGMSSFFFWMLDPSQALQNGLGSSLLLGIFLMIYTHLRSWTVVFMVSSCKRRFASLLKITVCLLPASLSLEYSLLMHPAISGITFETHLLMMPSVATILLVAIILAGVALHLPELSLIQIGRQIALWIRSHRRIVMKTMLGYVLVAIIVAAIVLSDSVLPIFTPKIDVHKEFRKPRWEYYDPLASAHVFLETEYELPVPRNATCRAYRLIELKYFVKAPWIRMLDVVYVRNPADLSTVTIGDPAFPSADDGKRGYVSIDKNAQVDLTQDNRLLRFKYKGGSALNISYWEETRILDLTAVYLERKSERIDNQTLRETYVFLLRNRSDMMLVLSSIGFDRFSRTEVDRSSIKAYINGTIWPHGSMIGMHRLHLGYSNISPGSNLNVTITLYSRRI